MSPLPPGHPYLRLPIQMTTGLAPRLAEFVATSSTSTAGATWTSARSWGCWSAQVRAPGLPASSGVTSRYKRAEVQRPHEGRTGPLLVGRSARFLYGRELRRRRGHASPDTIVRRSVPSAARPPHSSGGGSARRMLEGGIIMSPFLTRSRQLFARAAKPPQLPALGRPLRPCLCSAWPPPMDRDLRVWPLARARIRGSGRRSP